MTNPVPYDIFSSELLPGETVEWTGKPNHKVVFQSEDGLAIPFSLLWGGFAISWLLGAASRAAAIQSSLHYHGQLVRKNRKAQGQVGATFRIERSGDDDTSAHALEVDFGRFWDIAEIYHHARQAGIIGFGRPENGIADIRISLNCGAYSVVKSPIEEKILVLLANSDELAHIAS